MINKDGKLFNMINIIDLCIILAIIGAIGFFFIRLQKGEEIVAKPVQNQYEIKVYVEQIERFVIDGMSEGDTLYDNSKNISLGKITNIEIGDAIEFNPDKNGILVSSSKEGYNSLEITSVLTASPNENGISIEGNKYGVGHSLTVRAGKSIVYLRISGLEMKGNDE